MFLGWVTDPDGRHFYGRQLRDAKIAPPVEAFNPRSLSTYAQYCGWALARAHAKARDARTIDGYLGSGDQFDEALGDFGRAYADQAEMDYAALKSAIRAGKVNVFME